MPSNDLLLLFLESPKLELRTCELYQLAIKKFGIDTLYDDYEKHIRNLQQQLKSSNIITNTRHGYWALTARL